jgi:hypothetical protein
VNAAGRVASGVGTFDVTSDRRQQTLPASGTVIETNVAGTTQKDQTTAAPASLPPRRATIGTWSRGLVSVPGQGDSGGLISLRWSVTNRRPAWRRAEAGPIGWS